MGNFDFLDGQWPRLPELKQECIRAEAFLAVDPRSACFYARRAIELLTEYVSYDILDLPAPYRDDLSGRIHAPGFRREVETIIVSKLDLIRRLGNDAVHDKRPVRPDIALKSLRNLYDVCIWTAYSFGLRPDDVPTGSTFAPPAPPVRKPAKPAATPEELQRLERELEEARAEHEQKLAERESTIASQNAEIAQLRAELAAAQAAKTQTDTHDYNEAETRTDLIDVLLHQAGWDVDDRDQVFPEFPVTGMPNQSGNGFVDYVLFGADGAPLAVVEAKRTSRSAAVGQEQARLYADALEARFGTRPIIFTSNGDDTIVWDDAAGYPPRRISGFLTREQLALAIQRRTTRQPLADLPVDADIAGRYYQERAIHAIGQSFDEKQRRALLVMATGSGKTRTVIALVNQMMKANWAKNVLFLADRTALVNQAVNAFKEHLPQVSTVNLVTEKVADGRVVVSTYPTMVNAIDRGQFTPGHFDLIVIDEAHRSVYAKYGEIFKYFDGFLVGLTATPKDEVDHNTYSLFDLEDGVPTDAYSLDQAVADGYLVPPRSVDVGTKFLREGIRYDQLSDAEKDEWDQLEWNEDGAIPDAVGTEELNRFLFNADTVDKVLATLMRDGHHVAGGDRLGKTIIFAKNQRHAEFIQERFDAAFPEYGGTFARVITHATEYAQSLIDDFSVASRAPHIAISVDMLDTGIDVPEVVNLVFFKMVRSRSKFWQMLGRGTRLCPDVFGPGRDKEDFRVFDFCGNLEYFSQGLKGVEGKTAKSLTQRLFEGRVALVVALGDSIDEGVADVRTQTTSWLVEHVAAMNTGSFLVRGHRREVERFSSPEAWSDLAEESAQVALELAGVPSTLRDTDEEAKRFDLLILRRQLADVEGDAVTAERVRVAVQDIAADLLGRLTIPSVKAQVELLEEVAGDEWWQDVTLPMLELVRVRMRGLAHFIEKTRRNPVYTDFADELGEAREITLPGIAPGMDTERFNAKVMAFMREHEDNLAVQRLRRGMQLTGQDLEVLQEMLEGAGLGGDNLERAVQREGGLGLFVRSLVGLDRAAALEAFSAFLAEDRYTADQIRLIHLIVDELTKNGVMKPSRLMESPYVEDAATRVDLLFPEDDVDGIVGVLRDLAARARPGDDGAA